MWSARTVSRTSRTTLGGREEPPPQVAASAAVRASARALNVRRVRMGLPGVYPRSSAELRRADAPKSFPARRLQSRQPPRGPALEAPRGLRRRAGVFLFAETRLNARLAAPYLGDIIPIPLERTCHESKRCARGVHVRPPVRLADRGPAPGPAGRIDRAGRADRRPRLRLHGAADGAALDGLLRRVPQRLARAGPVRPLPRHGAQGRLLLDQPLHDPQARLAQ